MNYRIGKITFAAIWGLMSCDFLEAQVKYLNSAFRQAIGMETNELNDAENNDQEAVAALLRQFNAELKLPEPITPVLGGPTPIAAPDDVGMLRIIASELEEEDKRRLLRESMCMLSVVKKLANEMGLKTNANIQLTLQRIAKKTLQTILIYAFDDLTRMGFGPGQIQYIKEIRKTFYKHIDKHFRAPCEDDYFSRFKGLHSYFAECKGDKNLKENVLKEYIDKNVFKFEFFNHVFSIVPNNSKITRACSSCHSVNVNLGTGAHCDKDNCRGTMELAPQHSVCSVEALTCLENKEVYKLKGTAGGKMLKGQFGEEKYEKSTPFYFQLKIIPEDAPNGNLSDGRFGSFYAVVSSE